MLGNPLRRAAAAAGLSLCLAAGLPALAQPAARAAISGCNDGHDALITIWYAARTPLACSALVPMQSRPPRV